MVSGLLGKELPFTGLRVRIPCLPLFWVHSIPLQIPGIAPCRQKVSTKSVDKKTRPGEEETLEKLCRKNLIRIEAGQCLDFPLQTLF